MSRTLPVLSIARAFSQTAAPVIVLLGGIVGTRLAPSPDLVTLASGIHDHWNGCHHHSSSATDE